MTPKEYLSRARWLNARIDSKFERIQRLRALAGRVTASSASPGQIYTPGDGGRPDRRYDLVARIVDSERALDAEIDRLLAVKAEIAAAIDAVPDDRLRALLELRYLAFLPWDRVAEKMGYEVRQVHRLHGWALRQIVVPEDCDGGPCTGCH